MWATKKSKNWNKLVPYNKQNRKKLRPKGLAPKPASHPDHLSALGWNIFDVPTHLSFSNSKKEEMFFDFIDLLRSTTCKKIQLNFKYCKEIKVYTLIILHAELQELYNRTNREGRLLVGLVGANRNTRISINLSGIKNAMSPDSEAIDIEDNKFLPILSNKQIDYESITDFVQYVAFEDKLTPEQELKLASAISETILNVEQHAYPSKLQHRGWWVTCQIIGEQLYLAIYDRGVGIPKTIIKKKWFRATLNRLQKQFPSGQDDYHLLKAAMATGESQTRKQGRGQGTLSIRALVENNPDGTLLVISSKGFYTKDTIAQDGMLLIESIQGTLVQWNIKIT